MDSGIYPNKSMNAPWKHIHAQGQKDTTSTSPLRKPKSLDAIPMVQEDLLLVEPALTDAGRTSTG
jgi:hypothetical protein